MINLLQNKNDMPSTSKIPTNVVSYGANGRKTHKKVQKQYRNLLKIYCCCVESTAIAKSKAIAVLNQLRDHEKHLANA